jgi:hypothetical protein
MPQNQTKFTYGEGDNAVSIFADAEPYYYGDAAPSGNYFVPLGVDNDANTADIKVQAGDGSYYQTIKTVEGFTIGQSQAPLTYIEKGTFPCLNRPSGLLSWELPETYTNSSVQLTVEYNEDKSISKIKVGDYEGFNGYGIKRLGFILVGGGGGAGGHTDYDDCSSGGDELYVCPGAGGGGGETIWGVLNLEYPPITTSTGGAFILGMRTNESGGGAIKQINSITYTASIGTSGSVGTHAVNDGGSDGSSGGDTTLSIKATFTNFQGATKSTEDKVIIRAAGGKGGGKGTIDKSSIVGGNGGSSSYRLSTASDFFTNWYGISGTLAGTAGSSITLNTSNYNSSSATSVDARTNFLTVSSSNTPISYCKDCSQPSLSPAIKMTEDQDNLDSCSIPGGHSFGHGSGKTSSGVYEAAGWGGGGAGGNKSSNYGGKGFFGLYY